ncbi:MAG: glycosyltransferase family 2 protein [Pseudonocardia sp.]|uniref:glycosyltransferase family 2 protein n=1 Tax=unclassified Pseudonocardia TaxID=2619320 RepID=UPI00086CBBBF|nr:MULTISPECIES: galactosyltransferase-related protein [unclassified Pseudonocardia]MBN9107358.1 glycosyltransferase family 2 protein [Pseudonocardia sp.]ODU26670.1 MAG: sugar transferase [Pseudonocardia sp. SCN 72-51]ODV06599.1 MAG: sugar transferase [Pseudonocardia sp. SCN 73-27]
MHVGLITVAHGRHGHLRRQQAGLADVEEPPATRVVVAVDDPVIATIVAGCPLPDSRTVAVRSDGTGLPVAHARNVGAAAAIARGAELLVFLDVDCIPGPALFRRYREAAAGGGERLLCGPVAYLPPPPEGGYRADALATSAAPHPARPAPADGTCVDTDDHDLFWSLSFAVTTPAWIRLGGFHEGYRGYGGEDTDFGYAAAAAGVGLRWVGGATAFHQHHPVSDPPVEHLDDILRNGALFRRRWGRWPMTGWLGAFAAAGLVRHDPVTDDWEKVAVTQV